MSSQSSVQTHHAWGVGAIATCAAFTGLSFLFLCARLSTRLFLIKSLGYEDGFVSVAWLFSLTLTSAVIVQRSYGLGRPMSTVSSQDFAIFSKSFLLLFCMYNISLTCTKLSILVQYKRLFVTDWFQKAVNIMLAIVAVYGVATFLDSLFICWPIAYYWDKSGNGHCVSQWTVVYTNAVLNIVTDLMIIVSPMPVLKNLQVRRKQKLALMVVFAMGSFVCVISMLRLWLVRKAQSLDDITLFSVQPNTWSSLETNIGIITASLPTLKPLFVRLCPRIGSSLNSRTPTARYPTRDHRSIMTSVSKALGRTGPVPKSRREESDEWEVTSAAANGRGIVRQVDVEDRPTRSATLPGRIHVATTITHDYESTEYKKRTARSTEYEKRTASSTDEIELIDSGGSH